MSTDVTPDELRAELVRLGLATDTVDFDKLAKAQNDRDRRVPGWDAPRVLPANWLEHTRDDDGGAKYVNAAGRLVAILSCSRESDGRAWLHLSVSHALRVPTWGELRTCKETFLGDREALSIMPPRARYVNLHPNVLHLFALLNPEAETGLPDFSGGTGSL